MQEKELDYGKTLNLPKTSFNMKANLPNKEPLLLKEWNEKNIYKKSFKIRAVNCFFFAIIFSPSCANVSFLPGTLSLSLNTLLPSGKLTKLLSVGLLFSGTLLILPSGVYINSPSST